MKIRLGVKILLGLLSIVVSILFYLNTNYYVKKQSWKYRDGFHFGDWINFDEGNAKLEGRNIFVNGTQVAKLKFCGGKFIIVISSENNEYGYYINK